MEVETLTVNMMLSGGKTKFKSKELTITTTALDGKQVVWTIHENGDGGLIVNSHFIQPTRIGYETVILNPRKRT